MLIFNTKKDNHKEIEAAIKRPFFEDNPDLEMKVREIVDNVRLRGDEAVLEYSRLWDCPTLEDFRVPSNEFEKARNNTPIHLQTAIRNAAARITEYHSNQRRASWWMNTRDGGWAGQMLTPLERVGVYVPGGKAIYPSSVLMNCIPAFVAGVKEIILCVPPLKDGTLPPSVLFAAGEAGVDKVFSIGGAQAIAAMAFGTQTVPKVDKVVGPGNVYVNLAKRMIWGMVGVDMLAGPSEVCVVADETANPMFVAADLLVQAEHAEDCSAFLLTPDESLAKKVLDEIERQTALHPRCEILKASLKHSAVIITGDITEAIEWANKVAPEHLSLMVKEPMSWLSKVKSAGAILLGNYSPQSLGDYAAGPSHTLPTSGSARFASPLNVDDFVKKTSVISYDSEALQKATPMIEALGQIEGFDAHVYAAKVRKKGDSNEN
ncbi:MAG: histidinol dehydrogenase [bacterium]